MIATFAGLTLLGTLIGAPRDVLDDSSGREAAIVTFLGDTGRASSFMEH